MFPSRVGDCCDASSSPRSASLGHECHPSGSRPALFLSVGTLDTASLSESLRPTMFISRFSSFASSPDPILVALLTSTVGFQTSRPDIPHAIPCYLVIQPLRHALTTGVRHIFQDKYQLMCHEELHDERACGQWQQEVEMCIMSSHSLRLGSIVSPLLPDAQSRAEPVASQDLVISNTL